MGKELVKLNIVGITYNQIENGMYAMVLEEDGGSIRLPIIIGYNEAQSIECMLQKISTPRPLTHEFTSRILDSFGIKIESVLIKQLQNGIFTADVVFANGSESHLLDARSSDAIALAMRSGAPIYTTRTLLERCGVEKEALMPKSTHIASGRSIPARQAIEKVKKPAAYSFEDHSDEELSILLQKAVEAEDYEKAGEIKKEIDRRRYI